MIKKNLHLFRLNKRVIKSKKTNQIKSQSNRIIISKKKIYNKMKVQLRMNLQTRIRIYSQVNILMTNNLRVLQKRINKHIP